MVMPFGLINASTTCQEVINDALRQYLDIFVIAYLDDIMIYSTTLKEHVQHVSQVLECLDQRDLRLKSEKCEFHREKVDFLGFVVGRHGIRMNPKKIKAVREWSTPIDVKDIQAFIGKDTPWKWGSREEATFQRLKEECLKESILKMFDSKKSGRMEIDALDLAIDACFNQLYEGMWHSVAYYFRKLSLAEQNYDIHDKELLAIVAALEA